MPFTADPDEGRRIHALDRAPGDLLLMRFTGEPQHLALSLIHI